jgi:hypothetical protein
MCAKLTSERFPISPNFHAKNKSFRGNVRTIKRNISTEGLSGAFFFGGGKSFAQTRWALSELHHSIIHWRRQNNISDSDGVELGQEKGLTQFQQLIVMIKKEQTGRDRRVVIIKSVYVVEYVKYHCVSIILNTSGLLLSLRFHASAQPLSHDHGDA